MTGKYLAVFVAAVLTAGIVGCEREGPAERAGERVDETVERTGERLNRAVDD